MSNDEITESLLGKICYVIDILPSQMAGFGRYSEIEDFYLHMLLSVHGQTLYMEVYNPPLAAIANLSMLATAEGLFMRISENS